MQRTIEEIREILIYVHSAFVSQEELQNFELELDELIETVATLQREKCAEEAKLIYKKESLDEFLYQTNLVVQQSILNAKL